MRYRRIHILGGPGSGKSYIAAKITAAYGIEAYELDDLFWDPTAPTYGVRADKQWRDQALAALVEGYAWVIEGAYYSWVTPSFERADLIIILNPSVWLRDWRIVKRYALQIVGRRRSKKQETVASAFALIRWNHTYEKTHLLPARALLSRLNKDAVECGTLAHVLAALADGPAQTS